MCNCGQAGSQLPQTEKILGATPATGPVSPWGGLEAAQSLLRGQAEQRRAVAGVIGQLPARFVVVKMQLEGKHTFESALIALKDGRRIMRAGWPAGKTLSQLPSPDVWNVTFADVMANDWVILPPDAFF